ncbi:MAG: alpha/beta hydrolase [Oleibacter sp.]|nr:alpha/beta hydrolase [Thalassolituus sp.]
MHHPDSSADDVTKHLIAKPSISKPVLHIAHANGFTGGTYSSLAKHLSNDYQVEALDRIGHNPLYPTTDNWPHLIREFEEYIEQMSKQAGQPIIAVGHSLGGVLSLILALRRPDLVRALVMLDSPALPQWQSRGLQLLKFTRLNERLFPIRRIEVRRTLWRDFDEARTYFRSKSLMKRFDEQCLADYIRTATDETPDGLRLRVEPQIEADIWRTIPDNLHRYGKLKVPGTIIAGRHSAIFQPRHALYMKQRLGMRVEWTDGGHMYPLEQPVHTATLIDQALKTMLNGANVIR